MASVICRVPCKARVVQRTLLHSQARLSSHVASVGGSHHVAHGHDDHGHHQPKYRDAIGNREVVGYGMNGQEAYADSVIWPYPAIRFKRPESVSASLLQKEKGDWKNLSAAEKKELYRYSYCETFSEMHAPTGNWKSIIGIVCFWISVSLWVSVGVKSLAPPLPSSFTDEHRLANLKRMIDLRVNAVDGLASKWDYEKGRWKE